MMSNKQWITISAISVLVIGSLFIEKYGEAAASSFIKPRVEVDLKNADIRDGFAALYLMHSGSNLNAKSAYTFANECMEVRKH